MGVIGAFMSGAPQILRYAQSPEIDQDQGCNEIRPKFFNEIWFVRTFLMNLLNNSEKLAEKQEKTELWQW